MEVLEQDKKIWRDLDIQEQKCGDILKEIIRVKNIQVGTATCFTFIKLHLVLLN